jgi:hypothetical protein
MIGIHVNNCLLIGKRDVIDEVIVELKKSGLNLKVEKNLTDYLSCQMIENTELKEISIHQPYLINNLEAKCGFEVKSKRVYKTPGTPRFKTVRPENDKDIMELNLQSRYRSRFVFLLYLIKCSRPDLWNVVRELSKCFDEATMGIYLEMLGVFKFVIDTKSFCLKIFPESKIKNWSLNIFYDSDWAGDYQKRVSITGFIVI